MRPAAVYSCKSRTNSLSKEALIYGELDASLSALADLERYVLPEAGTAGAPEPTVPGFGHVRAHEAIVALGCAAHTVLADFQKRTLMTGDLDLEGNEESALADDIEQLVWSCSNTMGIVALGTTAWNAVQLLPVAERRFHHIPPLQLGGSTTLRSSILVIDHERDAATARMLVDVIGRSGLDVEYLGLAPSDASMRQSCWSDDSLIHVHVGPHRLDAEEIRLIDSWRSERLVLQLVPDNRSRRAKDEHELTIENEVNGILCASAEEVVSACRELLDDCVLRRKLISAGQSTIAPLMKIWGAVAEDLLA